MKGSRHFQLLELDLLEAPKAQSCPSTPRTPLAITPRSPKHTRTRRNSSGSRVLAERLRNSSDGYRSKGFPMHLRKSKSDEPPNSSHSENHDESVVRRKSDHSFSRSAKRLSVHFGRKFIKYDRPKSEYAANISVDIAKEDSRIRSSSAISPRQAAALDQLDRETQRIRSGEIRSSSYRDMVRGILFLLAFQS